MKIGIYSDVHISRTSSIMPLYLNENSKYTLRLQNCINSMNEMYQTFENKNVDLIINCGDTFNSHTISADEISSYLDINHKSFCKELVIVGNHDKYNNVFNSIELANMFDGVDVIDEYKVIRFKESNIDIYCMNYFDAKDFNIKLDEMLDKFPKVHKTSILFMHGDINGSLLFGNLRVENQISKAKLIQNFDLVINGHIHCNEVIYDKDDKKIINIGSLTSHSFADSNKHIGKYYILDTNDRSIESFEAKDQVIFRTYEINGEDDIIKFKEQLSMSSFKKIVKIKCKYELKDTLEHICQNDDYGIIKYKFIFIYDNNINESEDKINTKKVVINDEDSIDDKFLNFIKNQESLKYPYDIYETIIKGDLI